MNSADLCRKNGWTVGTILEGDEGNGPYRIAITAIGQRSILAKEIDDATGLTEGLWDLNFRDWVKVSE